LGLVLMPAGHWVSGTGLEEPCSIPKHK